jgi:hypothetical protein
MLLVVVNHSCTLICMYVRCRAYLNVDYECNLQIPRSRGPEFIKYNFSVSTDVIKLHLYLLLCFGVLSMWLALLFLCFQCKTSQS